MMRLVTIPVGSIRYGVAAYLAWSLWSGTLSAQSPSMQTPGDSSPEGQVSESQAQPIPGSAFESLWQLARDPQTSESQFRAGLAQAMKRECEDRLEIERRQHQLELTRLEMEYRQHIDGLKDYLNEHGAKALSAYQRMDECVQQLTRILQQQNEQLNDLYRTMEQLATDTRPERVLSRTSPADRRPWPSAVQRRTTPQVPTAANEKAVMIWDPVHGFQLKPLDELIPTEARPARSSRVAQAQYEIELDQEIEALNRQLRKLSERIEVLHRKRIEMSQRPIEPLKPVFAPDQPLNPIPARDRH